MGTVVRTRDRVSVGYDRTINIGNYESVKVSVHYGTDVRKGEQLQDAWERVEKEASDQLNSLVEPIEKQLEEKGD